MMSSEVCPNPAQAFNAQDPLLTLVSGSWLPSCLLPRRLWAMSCCYIRTCRVPAESHIPKRCGEHAGSLTAQDGRIHRSGRHISLSSPAIHHARKRRSGNRCRYPESAGCSGSHYVDL